MKTSPDIRLMALRYPARGGGDAVVSALAARLAGAGLRLAGLIQLTAPDADNRRCDMNVQLLGGDLQPAKISENRGQDARGCRLDSGALQQVARAVEAAITADTDLVVISKFGRQEAEGRGLREAIARALELDIPVLVGLRADFEPAFLAFAGDLGTVTDDAEAAYQWALTCP